MNTEETTRAIYTAMESSEPDSAGKYTSNDFVFSGPIPEPINFEKWAGLHKQLHSAFPDWSLHLLNRLIILGVFQSFHFKYFLN